MQTYCKESHLDYSANDNVLSYLTMAHILGRVVEEFALSCGASIGYWQVSHRHTPTTGWGVFTTANPAEIYSTQRETLSPVVTT